MEAASLLNVGAPVPATDVVRSPRQDELMTVAEVAQEAKLHIEVVRRAIRRGELRASKPCNRIRVKRNNFARWLDDCSVNVGSR